MPSVTWTSHDTLVSSTPPQWDPTPLLAAIVWGMVLAYLAFKLFPVMDAL